MRPTTALFAADLSRWRWVVPGFMAQLKRAEHTATVRSAKIFWQRCLRAFQSDGPSSIRIEDQDATVIEGD